MRCLGRSSRPLGTAAANDAVPWKIRTGFKEEVTADRAGSEGGKVPGARKTHSGKAPYEYKHLKGPPTPRRCRRCPWS